MGDHDEEQKDDYKVPTKVGINDIMDRDKDDAALENYKKQLLGATKAYAPKDDPRRVVVLEMHVLFEDRPAGDVVFKGLDKQENLDLLKKSSVIFKEACHYKLKFVFRVQHEIVTGLKYSNAVYKGPIRVAKEELMLGSYPPQETTHEVIWPRHGWEEAPSGLIARGSYKSTIRFIDDDDVTHLSFDYGFSIKSHWGKEGKEYVGRDKNLPGGVKPIKKNSSKTLYQIFDPK